MPCIAQLPPAHDPYLDLVPPQGIKLTPRHYAYLKISEGCNNRCSFCIIPKLRGDLVSRPADDVLREAERLVEGGRQGTAGHLAGHLGLWRRPEICRERWQDRAVRAQILRPRPRARRARRLGPAALCLPLPACRRGHRPRWPRARSCPISTSRSSTRAPTVLKAMRRPARAGQDAGAHRAWREQLPGPRAALDLHRRLPRRDRRRFRLPARLARRSRDRPRRLLQIRAGRGRRRQCDRRRGARRGQAAALQRADGASAEDFGAPPEAQGRHATAGDHRRGRADGRQRSVEGRRARDRRQRLPVEPPAAARSARSSPRRSSARTNTIFTAAWPGF